MNNDDKYFSKIKSEFKEAKDICNHFQPVRPEFFARTDRPKPKSYDVLRSYVPTGVGSPKHVSQSLPPAPVPTAGVVDESKSPRSTPPAEKARAQVAPIVEQPVVQQAAGGLKPNESRPFHIGIRLSENEREYVVQQAEKARLTISEYARASILGAGYVSSIDPVKQKQLQDISRELGRQGNNLNQIAKHLNAATASPAQGESMLAMIARTLMSAHMRVARALAEGKTYQ
jgi:hypothetical protein